MSNIIELLSVFNTAKQMGENLNNNVLLFRFQVYSYIFVTQLFNCLKTNYLVNFVSNLILLEVKDLKLVELKTKLNSNFLGQKVLYFIKDMPDLEINKKQDFYNFLKNYNGPNLIFIFDQCISKTITNNFLTFDIPTNLDNIIYNKYYSFFYSNYKINSYFTRKLFKIYNKVIPLDLAFNIMKYQPILSNKNDKFFENWLSKIAIEEKSIFDLTRYFFEKQIENFFELWLKYKADYPVEFWISFWSDQIWQAINVIIIAKKYGILKAKKYSTKLPFSFFNKGYKSYNVQHLIQVHQDLYLIDYNIKNDVGYNALEFWFCKLLFNKF